MFDNEIIILLHTGIEFHIKSINGFSCAVINRTELPKSVHIKPLNYAVFIFYFIVFIYIVCLCFYHEHETDPFILDQEELRKIQT